MAQAAPVCSADPSAPRKPPVVSTGLPSPASSPTGRPATPEGDAPAGAEARAGRDAPGAGEADAAPAHTGAKQRWAPSPSFSAKELVLAALGGVLLAILTTWPLVLHMGSRISPDIGDPVRTAWEVAWVGHAMLHSPLHLFDSNAFYPHPLSLAFSDSLLGYGPAAFFGSGTIAALVRYNLLFLFAWSLCFFGAYLLARELGLRKIAAGAAAAAFAYAPYRVTEAGHLHVISSGGIALALFLLLRGYRRGSGGLVLAGWLVSAWQISLGFTLGMQYAYLLAVLALVLAFAWWRGARPFAVTRRLAIFTAVGVAVLGAVTIYQARPYLRVSHIYPTAKRTIKEVENYSSGPAALLSASSENRVWGPITSGVRDHVHSKNEDVFFPGGLILVLAVLGLLGLGGSRLTTRLRLGLLAGVVVCSVLAMGLGLTGAGYPYRLLFDYAPGWNGVRVPGRVFTLATLFYALLAGAGAQWLYDRARRLTAPPEGAQAPRGRAPLAAALPALTGGILLLGLLGEGAGHLGHPAVPQPTRAEQGLPGPRLDLPTDGAHDRIWQYYSTDGFYKIPIGNSTFDMPAVDDLRGGMNGFPDKASIEKLRYYGIKTVVLHLNPIKELPPTHGYATAEPPDVAAAAQKPIAGLGVTRRQAGSSVIYEIGPGPAALHGSD
jgi:hypothetical protein